jgi:hypothetical protein
MELLLSLLLRLRRKVASAEVLTYEGIVLEHLTIDIILLNKSEFFEVAQS